MAKQTQQRSNLIQGTLDMLILRTLLYGPAQPALGRGFIPETPRFGAEENGGKIVLSDAVWKQGFGADRTVIGQSFAAARLPRVLLGIRLNWSSSISSCPK